MVIRIDKIFRVVNLLPLANQIEGGEVLENVSFDSLDLLTVEGESPLLLENEGERQKRVAEPD